MRKKGRRTISIIFCPNISETFLTDWTRARENNLLEKGAEWEEKNGRKVNAIRLYYRAGAYERIFKMPHTSYDLSDIEDENTRNMIFDILNKTPRDVKLRYPESMVPLAFILFFIGENEKLAETIGEILELTNGCGLSDDRKNTILGETELLISFTKYNDIAEMSRHHRRAYKLLGKKASLINIRSTWSFGSPSVMCLYHSKPGFLAHKLELMDECMPYYYRLNRRSRERLGARNACRGGVFACKLRKCGNSGAQGNV